MSDKAQNQPVSHEAIAEQFQSLRSQTSQLSSSLNDISAEHAVIFWLTHPTTHKSKKYNISKDDWRCNILQCMQEHQAVIKALEQLDPSRKCFRLVGEVLVERTVQEVLPAVKSNAEQLEMVQFLPFSQAYDCKQGLH